VINRIGPNSPTAPPREQVRPEAGAQLPGVGQDGQERADRRGREGRARVEQRQHHPGCGEDAADRVGERQRQRPSQCRETERAAGDPAQVELVAGEEEQHPEPEVGEEPEELRRVEPEHLRPDHDPEQQLDDDHRDEHAPAAEQGRDGARDRGDGDDDEEVPRIHRHGHIGDGKPCTHATYCTRAQPWPCHPVWMMRVGRGADQLRA
jgi:hypothetical protein